MPVLAPPTLTDPSRRPAPTTAVRLVVARGKPIGKEISITMPRFTIGRAKGCQLRPHSEWVSRWHAELTVTPDGVLIRDLGSRNGTRVNGRAVTASTPLRDGDRIRIGPLAFTVSILGVPARTAARPPSAQEILEWVADAEEDGLPGRPDDVYCGDTKDEDPQPLSDADAAELLTAMAGRRSSAGGIAPGAGA